MNTHPTNKIVIFPNKHSSVTSLYTDQEAIDVLLSAKGIKRSSFHIPLDHSKSAAHVDLIVIDERKGFNLRHVIFTVWHQNSPVGFYDLATPHLFKDTRVRLFGQGNETLPTHMNTHLADEYGIPAQELRHGKHNTSRLGSFFLQPQVEEEVVTVLTTIGNRIIDRFTEKRRLEKLHRLSTQQTYPSYPFGGTL